MTSFKRDGTGVATPVWFVSDGRRLFAFTDLHSAKVRRIRRDPHVLVASCRVDGKLHGEPMSARAEVLTADAELERVQKLLLARYKISYRVVMLFYRLGAVFAASGASPTAPRLPSRWELARGDRESDLVGPDGGTAKPPESSVDRQDENAVDPVFPRH